jgi:DNA polymerase III subunit epsilon
MLPLAAFSSGLLSQRSWPFGLPGAKPAHPLLIQSKDYFSGLDQSKSLKEYDFVVLDTELTGLKVKKDEIVSIGAVCIRDMRIDINDSFYCRVCPSMDVPKQSTLIHRITPAQASQATPLEDALLDLLEYCGNSVIIGHNINLDTGVINRELKRHFNGELRNICIDTMRLARVYEERQWVGSFESYDTEFSCNLKKLSLKYNLPLFAEHNALTDALQTAYLFLFLVHKLQDVSFWTLKDLCRTGCARLWGRM